MRAIKFRAWHRGYQKEGICKAIAPQMIFEDSAGQCFMWRREKQPLEIMQFTGLLDKNGKEIYEGDVVSARHPASTITGIVEYHAPEWKIRSIKSDTLWAWGLSSEVIGNIYENPDLLL